MRLFSTLALAVVGLTAACSSSTTTPATTSDTGVSCGISDKAKVTSVTKKSGGDTCPTLTPEMLNSTEDTGPDTCVPVSDTKACTVKINCTSTEGGNKTVTTGSFAASGGKVSGDLTVTITPADGTPLTCTYTIVFG